MKNSNINVRISNEVRDELEELGRQNNSSISEISRIAITKYVDESIIGPLPRNFNQQEIDILQTLEFTEFIFWIYEKKRNPDALEIIELYRGFIKLIESFRHHSLFMNHPVYGNEIQFEFEKIYADLNDYINGRLDNEVFLFATNDAHGFNYNLLADWFHCLRYDDENNRIVNLK